MDPWVFNDGTKVWLGGRVDGEGSIASSIRERLSLLRDGYSLGSGWGTQPDTEELDVDVPHLLDCWLRTSYPWLVSAPAVTYPPIPDGEASTDPERFVVH